MATDESTSGDRSGALRQRVLSPFLFAVCTNGRDEHVQG